MRKLHLVGFTPDLDGLILSTRKGAKSGSFIVAIDPAVLRQLADPRGAPGPAPTARSNGSASHAQGPRPTRPDSHLGPREMQELLRGGWTLEEVAVEAGVDVDWVSRFAAPVLAEMRLVLDQARPCVFERPRVGPSALPLAASVRRNAAERGVRFTDEDFDDAWRAYQLDDSLWVVAFEYQSRGKLQSAEWTIDLETNELTSRGRLGTQLGYVQSARRRVDMTPPPKPKPKAAASRAVRSPAPPVPAAKAKPKATPARVTPRAAKTAKATKSAAKAKKKPATSSSKSTKPRAEVADPWREELRRRELERTAQQQVAAPPEPPPPPPTPAPRPAAAPAPPPRRAPEPELRPVAIIGPTVRTLARRPPPRREPPPPPPRRQAPPPRRAPEPDTGPTPAVRDELPDLRWSPQAGRVGPLPPPEPLPVPEQVRERVATPLGQVEDDELGADTWFPPPRPVFKGAQAAGADAPPRRRRSEPLRGR